MLSPAALQRVRLYVRAFLEEPLPPSEPAARAGLTFLRFGSKQLESLSSHRIEWP